MRNNFIIILLFTGSSVFATHLRGGWISVTQLSAISNTCQITVTVFTDTGSGVLFGGSQDYLDLGDGERVLIPETPNSPMPGLGPEFGFATFTLLHTYPSPGRYIVSYTEPNRNEGVINMDNSVLTPFHTQTTIFLDPLFGITKTPDFLTTPIFLAKSGEEFSMSLGAFLDEDYTITYDLTTPMRSEGVPVNNYRLPENFKINEFNGLITLDTKFLDQFYYTGEFAFAVRAHVFKEIDGSFYKLSTVVLDFQIIVEDGVSGGNFSDNIDTDDNNRIFIPVGESQTIKVFYETSETTASSIGLEAYSILSEREDLFSFSTYDSSTNDRIKVGVLSLSNAESIVRNNPFLITVRATDDWQFKDAAYLFYTKDLYPQVITGIHHEEVAINIFPNPVTDFLTVSLPENVAADISILDCFGRVINSCKAVGTTVVDVQRHPSGIYFCKIRSGHSNRIVKFIKH